MAAGKKYGKSNDLGRVRILGLGAPELARDGQPAMCGATEAKEEMARLLEDRDVELVADPQQPDRETATVVSCATSTSAPRT